MPILKGSNRGFSLIETMIASAMTGMIVLGASTVMTNTVGSQKKTDVQSLIDREFAAATQLAANAEIVRAIVRPQDFGDSCLTKDKNTGCGAHVGGWALYPNVGAGTQTFNTSFNLLGPCNETDPRCMVKRQMLFRWVCSDAECSGVETKVVVQPLQKEALNYRARETIVKLDRRQLMNRAELEFSCTNGNQSLTGVDYDRARDGCAIKPETSCPNMPGKKYNPFDSMANNCADNLATDCPYGYNYTGYFQNATSCKVPENNGAPYFNEYAGSAYYSPFAGPVPSASNPSTSYQTVTSTYVTTVTVTEAAPPPTCDMSTHTLYEYYNGGIGGYYYPVGHDPVAEGQGYVLTGETMTVFSNNCGTRPRAKISDCFYSAGFIGYHYLSSDDNCNLGGSPNASAFGWTERTSGPGYSVVVHRYDSGNTRKTTIGPNPGGFTHAGDMGYIPGGGAAPFVCSEGATQPGQACNDGTGNTCTQTCYGNAWQESCSCGGGGGGSNDGGGDGGN